MTSCPPRSRVPTCSSFQLLKNRIVPTELFIVSLFIPRSASTGILTATEKTGIAPGNTTTGACGLASGRGGERGNREWPRTGFAHPASQCDKLHQNRGESAAEAGERLFSGFDFPACNPAIFLNPR